MNLKEAYTTLELSEGSSQDEAKKKYRELTKKWHPDVNKSPEAEAKFKKINEAYECVKNGQGNDRQPPPAHGAGWNPFHQQQVVQLENIELHLTIDFKESVLGCKREMKYPRQAKCQACGGQGEMRLNNGCTKCGGSGQTTVKRQGAVFISTCPQCGGRSSVESCKACNGHGLVDTDVSVHALCLREWSMVTFYVCKGWVITLVL